MVTEVPRVGLVGVNGYGRTHLRNAARLQAEGRLRLVAYADVAPTAAGAVAKACPYPVRGHPSFEELLAAEDLDVAVLATPIPLHATMIRLAFEHGVPVLVEKPPVVTIQDLDALLRLGDDRGLACQVGFQTARSPAVDALGDLVRSGALGDVDVIAMIGRWQRADSYYARTAWAGRLVHDGRYVLDGTLTNPFAHGLMNALLVAGPAVGVPATPATVQAELYRCRDIEGDDTSSVRITTTDGTTVVLAATLCAGTQTAPRIVVKGSLATARLSYTTGQLDVEPAGTNVPTPTFGRDRPDLLANLVEVVGGADSQLLSPLRMSRGFVLALDAMYESAGRPRPVLPPDVTVRHDNGERWVHLDGVDSLIEHCALHGQLFSEAGASWASPTKPFTLESYQAFDAFS